MSEAPSLRNVLFMVLVQWSAGALAATRNNGIRMPALDVLAADSFIFQCHFAQCMVGAPARASLLTVMFQHNHGVTRNRALLPDGFTNLAIEMRKVGREPVLLGCTDTSLAPCGRAPGDAGQRFYESVLPGFDAVLPLVGVPQRWLANLDELGYPFGADVHAAHSPARRVPGEAPPRAPAQFNAEHSVEAFLTDELLRFISVRRNQSWFARAAYIKPRPPFIASVRYDSMSHSADMPVPRRMVSSAAEAEQRI